MTNRSDTTTVETRPMACIGPRRPRYGYDEDYDWARFDESFDCGLLRRSAA